MREGIFRAGRIGCCSLRSAKHVFSNVTSVIPPDITLVIQKATYSCDINMSRLTLKAKRRALRCHAKRCRRSSDVDRSTGRAIPTEPNRKTSARGCGKSCCRRAYGRKVPCLECPNCRHRSRFLRPITQWKHVPLTPVKELDLPETVWIWGSVYKSCNKKTSVKKDHAPALQPFS